MEHSKSQNSNRISGWVGVWGIGAGALLLAERLNWISSDLKWGVPLLLMIFGGSIVYDAIKSRKG